MRNFNVNQERRKLVWGICCVSCPTMSKVHRSWNSDLPIRHAVGLLPRHEKLQPKPEQRMHFRATTLTASALQIEQILEIELAFSSFYLLEARCYRVGTRDFHESWTLKVQARHCNKSHADFKWRVAIALSMSLSHVYVYVYIHISLHIYIYIYIFVCIYIYIFVCIYI